MNEINETNFSEQTKFRLSEIIEDYFHQEVNERKWYKENLSKYGTAFDYIDKILIVLSATSSRSCIFPSASVIGAPVGIISASLTLILSLTTRSKKKKHDKILTLTKSKLVSIETLVSQSLK